MFSVSPGFSYYSLFHGSFPQNACRTQSFQVGVAEKVLIWDAGDECSSLDCATDGVTSVSSMSNGQCGKDLK